jgi:hypothetical protein
MQRRMWDTASVVRIIIGGDLPAPRWYFKFLEALLEFIVAGDGGGDGGGDGDGTVLLLYLLEHGPWTVRRRVQSAHDAHNITGAHYSEEPWAETFSCLALCPAADPFPADVLQRGHLKLLRQSHRNKSSRKETCFRCMHLGVTVMPLCHGLYDWPGEVGYIPVQHASCARRGCGPRVY